MRRVGRIVGAVCLACALVMALIPANLAEAVSGSAAFDRKENKLISYTGTAEAVSVPSGIRTICEDAFAGNAHIRTLYIPSSVEVIENGAFRGCSNLREVTFSSGLSEIGSGAFSLCENLTSVHLSDTVLKIGAGVFAGDNRLGGIDIGKNPYFVCEDGVLYNRDRTKLIAYFSSNRSEKFIMPDRVKDVERYAFWGCRNLEQVELSPYLYSIPEYAFANCRDLKEVEVPYSVRKIDAKAFEDCVRLKSVAIPISVTQIHETAFDGCGGVRIIAEEGSYAKTYYTQLREKQEADKVTEKKDYPLGLLYDSGKTETSVSGNTADDGDPANEGQNTEIEKGLPSVYNPGKPSDVSKLHVSEYYAKDGSDVIGKARIVSNHAVVLPEIRRSDEAEETPAFEPKTVLADDGSHVIPKKKYYEDPSLTDVTLDAKITEIGDFAFARSAMTGIRIPGGVTKIGYGAFYHCDNLTYVDIPSTVDEILPQAFDETPYLKKWMQGSEGSDFLVVGNGILIAYRGDSGVVTIPDNVKKIAGGAFRDHGEIFKVELDDDLTEIGEGAFEGCVQLANLSGMGHVRKIADRAFADCPLTKVHLGNEAAYVGLNAFASNQADAVVFESVQKLPALSYEQTSTRYDNAAYRDYPFGTVTTAVVSSKAADDFRDTILDEHYIGFRGYVVSLPNGKENEDSAKNVARLEYCTALPDTDGGNLKVPQTVRIDGRQYTITSIAAGAFAPYMTLSEWADVNISAILLPDGLGQIADYEPDLALGAAGEQETGQAQTPEDGQAGENAASADADKAPSYTETVDLGSDYPNAALIRGDVADDTNPYILYVGKSDAEYDLEDAVADLYGTPVAGQLATFDLRLVEKNTNIPISNIGMGQMRISVPISETLSEQDICAVSLAEDGSLQMHYGTKERQEDVWYFSFSTNHFSPYGIYAGIGEQAEMIRKQSQDLSSLDVSPDTGEHVNPFWILAVAFGCIGMIFVLLPFKR